jgi:hypothetical protein
MSSANEITLLDNQSPGAIDHGPWRIEMLANGNGFPNNQGADDFGYRFGGPGLNGKSISIRWAGVNLLAMKTPSLVASEMAKDAAAGAGYTIAGGLVLFHDGDARADTAIRRAAALIRALPDTPLAIYREKTKAMPTAPVG